VLGPKANRVTIAAFNQANGFNDLWFVQYLHYMGNLLRGNLGYSYKLNQNVDALFRERWARSVYLTGITLVLSVVIAVPLGIYQAIRRNTLDDYMVTSLAFIVYAMPVFFLGLILIQVFSLNLHVFGYEASQSNSIFAIVGTGTTCSCRS
jgi:peptide/nickel transport system permease protein